MAISSWYAPTTVNKLTVKKVAKKGGGNASIYKAEGITLIESYLPCSSVTLFLYINELKYSKYSDFSAENFQRKCKTN